MLGLNRDGTAVLDLGSGPIRLRRPTLGEFRRLREQAWAITETASSALEALSVTPAADDADDAVVTTAAERRKMLHEATETMDDAWQAWTADALSALGDREAPERDDWPAWAGTQDVPTRLMGHWRDVPLASGAPPR